MAVYSLLKRMLREPDVDSEYESLLFSGGDESTIGKDVTEMHHLSEDDAHLVANTAVVSPASTRRPSATMSADVIHL